MRIAVLGPLTVESEGNGRLGPRDRIVLAALAARAGHTVRPDQLADALWTDEPPTTWPKVVQGCVSRLRKSLGTTVIETGPQGYRLVLPADEVDSRRFEQLVGRSRELLAVGEPERAAFMVDEALALWRGEPLAEVEGWAVGNIEARRLEELHRDAEEIQLDAMIRAGRSTEVLAQAQARAVEEPLREHRWALLALAQYQTGRQADALRTLNRIKSALASELGLDPSPELIAMEQAILRQDPSLAVEAVLVQPSERCPYQGLVPYDVTNADAFFGRDADVAACLRRLTEDRAVVVVGPSGSGKSSLVQAGVAAALQRDGRRVHIVTPGSRPLDALTGVPQNAVLVVDQCEEAVMLAASAEDRAAFFAALAERADLVVALRADRMGELAAHPAFARLVERALYLLNPMSPDDLRACVERPAQQAGLLLEPGLVDLLLREVEGEPGALPLLSHALRETWAEREGRTLTVAGYQRTGGVRGAVARSAEEVYGGLGPELQHIARDVLLRLVATGPSGEPVRARIPRRLLTTDAEHERVVEQLVQARLVTSDEGVLEIAHEALARAWPRLQEWLHDDVEGQRVRHHLAGAADAWDGLGRADSELYRGVRLAQALDWQDRSGPELTAVEQAFLDASRRRVDAELRAARERAEHEATARRRTRRLATGLAGVLALALVAAGLATYFQREATTRAEQATAASTVADASRLALLSGSVGALDSSLLLAVEAFERADTPATRDALFETLMQHGRAEQVVPLGGSVASTALTDDGTTLLVALRDQVVSWAVGTTAEPETVIDVPANTWVLGASDNGRFVMDDPASSEPRVLVRDHDGTVFLDLSGYEEVGGWPAAGELTPDGSLLRLLVDEPVEEGYQAIVRTVEVSSGREIDRRIDWRPGEFVGGRFSPDASTLVAWQELPDMPDAAGTSASALGFSDGSSTRLRTDRGPGVLIPLDYWPIPSGAVQGREDGSLALFDRRGAQIQVLGAHSSVVLSVVMPQHGRWAASADEAGVVNLWDVAAETGRWSLRETLVGHQGPVRSLHVSPSGDRLMSVSDDGSLISWDTSPQAGFGEPFGDGFDDRWVSNRPAIVMPGELVVAPTRLTSPVVDGEYRDIVAATFVDPRSGEVVDEVPVGRGTEGTPFGSSVSVQPGGRFVAVTRVDDTTILDARAREVVARIALPGTDDGYFDTEAVWSSIWTPDGSRLLIGGEGKVTDTEDGGLAVVDPATWSVERRIQPGRSPQALEFSPDGKLLAYAVAWSGEGTVPAQVLILDATTYDVVAELPLPEGAYPYDVSFSADGEHLAAVGDRGLLTVFETASWSRMHESVEIQDGQARQVEWLADGETLVIAGIDGTVALYDVVRDLIRAQGIPASDDRRSGMTHVFPSDGDELVVSADSGPGRRYVLDVQRWIAYACQVAARDLTAGEWDRFMPGRPYHETCTHR